MPGLRTLATSAIGGLIVFGVVEFWLRWPTFLAISIGSLLGVVFLMFAASIGDDNVAADVAWQRMSADLYRTGTHALGPAGLGAPESMDSGQPADDREHSSLAADSVTSSPAAETGAARAATDAELRS